MGGIPFLFYWVGVCCWNSGFWRQFCYMKYGVTIVFWCRRANLPEEENLALNGYRQLRQIFQALDSEESGQDLVEYALVATVIALGAAATMGVVAQNINDVFSRIATKFQAYGS
jgi:Flp pilus assembly pilin Flp